MNGAKGSLLMALALAGCGDNAPQPAESMSTLSAPPARCGEVPPAQRAGSAYASAPLAVPREYLSFVTPGVTRLGVTTLGGSAACVDLDNVSAASDYAISRDGRFFGFATSGHEFSGYTLVDRAGAGAVIETGVAPLFSPTRRRFAAAQMSEAAFGGLEGIGVWEASETGTTRIVTITGEAPRGSDWRVDRWGSEDCAALSMLPPGKEGGPRTHLQLRIGANTWASTVLPAGTAACAGS